MAVWIYRRENKAGGVVIAPGDEGWNKLIAQDVSPEHGPLLALAPRLEGVLRELVAMLWHDGCDYDTAMLRDKARAILREIDAAKEAL